MKEGTIASLVAVGFVLTIAQFISALSLPVLALVAAAAIGALSFSLFRVFGTEPGLWTGLITPPVASMIGVLPGVFAGRHRLLALAPVIAFSAAGLKVFISRRTSRRCSLCLRWLDSTLFFICPRCGLVVCDEGCWDFDRCRCRLCVQNKVPAFLGKDSRWWDRQFGSRVTSGHCLLCLAAAEGTDLRACPNCSRLQCRACWDESNGQCVHCGWILPELPPPLRTFMLPARNARP